MATQKQIAANKRNARLSTGPTSDDGKAIVAANATKSGSYAMRHLVLASLGESAESYDSHSAAIVATLAPVGALEERLGATIASLTWRLRRIPQFETAASRPPSGSLPLHPDRVEPKAKITMDPPSASAPPAEWLAYTRDRLEGTVNSLDCTLGALERFQSWTRKRSRPEGDDFVMRDSMELIQAAGRVMGWPLLDYPDPWADVARQIGLEVLPEKCPQWTYSSLMKAFDHLAQQTGRTPVAFRRAVRDSLTARIAMLSDRLENVRRTEQELIEQTQAERDRAVAVSVYASEGAVAGIQKAENHLTRQLERNLAMLERLQSRRREADTSVTSRFGDPLGLTGRGIDPAAIGFVFHPGFLPAPDRENRPMRQHLPVSEGTPAAPLFADSLPDIQDPVEVPRPFTVFLEPGPTRHEPTSPQSPTL